MSAEISRPSGDLPDEDLLATAVREVEGVAGIYASSPLRGASRRLRAAATGSSAPGAGVEVRRDGDAVALAVKIGTHRGRPTPETARRVADALLAGVPAGEERTVAVQVSRIV